MGDHKPYPAEWRHYGRVIGSGAPIDEDDVPTQAYLVPRISAAYNHTPTYSEFLAMPANIAQALSSYGAGVHDGLEERRESR